MNEVDSPGDALRCLLAWETALVLRMLHWWDPSWGEPVIIHQELRATDIPDVRPRHTTWQASTGIVGLGRREPDFGTTVMVRAADHLGPDNRPLPPEGPWPLPAAIKAVAAGI